MPDRSEPRPSRSRRPGPRRSTRPKGSSAPRSGRGALRERLKRDPFLFMLCLGGLGFLTWALALTWWVTGGFIPLALALVCIGPAIGLIYLRDA